MVYQIVFNISFPIYDDKRTSEEIWREFSLKLEEHDILSKVDKFQTHDNCWFVSSELTAGELHKLISPNKNVNIIISQVNFNMSGNTSVSFWKWFKEKLYTIDEMSENNI